MLTNVLIVFLGGGLGSLLRFGMNKMLEHQDTLFPLPTFFANVISSLILGLAVYLFMHHFRDSHAWSLFLTVGLCGGFSTFSTFSIETLDLLQRGETGMALINVALSILTCIGAILLGFEMGKLTIKLLP